MSDRFQPIAGNIGMRLRDVGTDAEGHIILAPEMYVVGGAVGGGSGGAALAAAGKQTAITATGAGDQVIAAADPNRARGDFVNNSDTAVRVTEGEPAAPDYGYRLEKGGSYFFSTQDAIHVCPESGNADCFGYSIAS